MGHLMSLVDCHDRFMEPTEIIIPPHIMAPLEATAIANNRDPEEIILAAIEAFLAGQDPSEK